MNDIDACSFVPLAWNAIKTVTVNSNKNRSQICGMKETLCSQYLFHGSALENDVDATAAPNGRQQVLTSDDI
jgi:hypothetical protein